MTHLKLGAVLLVTLFAGCASLPPECKTEYAHTLPHCPHPRTRPPENASECKEAGGVPAYQNGSYAGCLSEHELRDLIRSLPSSH